VVFVSHNHYDHLDVATIKRLAKKHAPLFITPLGNKKLLQTAGAKKVIELDWWQSTRLPSGEVFLLTQVHHWSARTMFDRNKALWGGLVIEASGLKIYFGGDSGYGPHYKETRRRYGAMDLSLLPIGAYEPRWFMKDQHMNPAEAVQAHLDLGSRFSVGMHFGTFQLTDEAVESPAIELQEALIQANLKPSVFTAPKNGETELYRLQKTKPLSREF
jgi:L-ascorbate metabolism protein UlaG (beta-lactamase superfamily)